MFSSHGGKASRYFSAMASASASESPQLRTTSLSTGVSRRAAMGWVSGIGPVTPRTTPVRAGSYHSDPVAPASRSTSRATIRLSSWTVVVTSSWLGGIPNSPGENSVAGMNPPRVQ